MLNASLRVNKQTLIALERGILKGLANHFQRVFEGATKEIDTKLKRMVADAIQNSPEAQSLLHGILHHQLGVKDPEAALVRIIELVLQSCKAFVNRVRVRGGGLTGGITVRALKLDFGLLLRAAAVKFKSEGGSRITWLEWLLERGTQPVVMNYEFVNLSHPTSRTGRGFMRFRPGATWSVPTQFAGTHKDNWLTRAIDPIARPVALMVRDTVIEHLRLSGAVRSVR